MASNNSNNQSDNIENAEKIIEKFGGIRPMAAKLSVPVTTVQGWKKRNAIPSQRKDLILSVAQEHNIDISKYVEGSAANQSVQQSAPKTTPKAAEPKPQASTPQASAPQGSTTQTQTQAPQQSAAPKVATPYAASGPSAKRDGHRESELKLKEMRDSAVRRSLIFTGGSAVVLGLIGLVLFNPFGEKPATDQIASIEKNVDELEERTSVLERFIPEDYQATIDSLKLDAQNFRASITNRVSGLENQLRSMPTQANLGTLMSRIDAFSQSEEGQEQLSQTVNQLAGILDGMEGRLDTMDEALDEAKSENEELAQTLSGISGKDLEAATYLLALGQFRNMVGSNNSSFQRDLAILRKLVGNDDPELAAALDRLEPLAENGVLTPDGLKTELAGMSGDILRAQLAGEDVSISDQAMGRLDNFLSVKKNGESLTSTSEQQAVNNAKAHLDAGNVEAAMAELSKLQGPSKEAASPWMDMAEGYLASQNVEEVILQKVIGQVSSLGGSGLFGGGSSNGGATIQPRFVP